MVVGDIIMVIIPADVMGTITWGSLTTVAGTGAGTTLTPVPLG